MDEDELDRETELELFDYLRQCEDEQAAALQSAEPCGCFGGPSHDS